MIAVPGSLPHPAAVPHEHRQHRQVQQRQVQQRRPTLPAPERRLHRVSRTSVLSALVLLAALFAGCGPSRAELEARREAVRGELAATLQGDALPAAARQELEQRRAWRAMQTFYGEPDAETVWVDGEGPKENVDALIALLEPRAGRDDRGDDAAVEAGDKGERGETAADDRYGAALLTELRETARRAAEEAGSGDAAALARPQADLELTASHAFLARAIHTVQGRVDPADLNVQWFTEGRKAEPLELLARVRDGAAPEEVLADLEPRHEAYHRLLEARERYRRIADGGGWPSVPAGDEVLKEGAEGPRVTALRRRLAAEGDLDARSDDTSPDDASSESASFDAATAEAVRRFQERNGLEADGVAGGSTLEALNIPVEDRLRTLEVNLERWRWMPGELGDHYVAVNIPDYRLRAVRDGEVELEMNVIVGKPLHETPVFSDTMTYLVLNPEWNIPASIAEAEVVPKILGDPSYAESQGIEVVNAEGERVPARAVLGRVEHTVEEPDGDEEGFFGRLFGGDGPETEVRQVRSLPEGHRLRQAPGRQNPLGQVKFMFPNEHNIYLHDTPADSLFARSERGFSHGCIRLERPLELADYVLRGDRSWNPEHIREVVAAGERTEVKLPEEIPVHLTYFTAWVDDEGRLHFRDDLYGHDARLAAALAAEPPLTLDLAALRGAGSPGA